MATNSVYQQSEVVRKKLPNWMTQKWNVAMDLIKKGEVTQIGERNFRIPANVTLGGRFGTYNPQGGDQGRGTAQTGIVMIAPAYPLRLNFELDFLSIEATESKAVAIQNPFKEAIKNGIPEMMLYRDKLAHTDGTAVIGLASATATVSGATQYTLDAAQGVMLMRRGQYVTTYDNGLTAPTTSGQLYISQWNPQAKTILLSGLVPGAASNDKICFEGVSGASPLGINGTKYYNNSATSGTTLNINRANENEIIANSVNAAGGLTNEHGMALYHRILKRRGRVADAIVGLCPVEQQASIYANVMSIQKIDLDTTSAKAVDRLPALKGKETFMWCGMPHMVDIHQDSTRIDYLIPELFGWARLKELGFFETPGKSGPEARFFQLYGGSGAPANSVWFGLTCNENLYSIDPGAGGFIYGLTASGLY